VELAVALLFLLGAVLFGPSPEAVAFGLLSFASVVLVATDLQARILPDEITFGVLAAGLLLAAARDVAMALRPAGTPLALSTSHLLESVAGAALGALLLLAVRKAYEWLRAAEGMGLGDVHMIAMIGALSGAAGVLLTLLFASAAGALGGGVYVLLRRARWTSRFSAARRDAATALAAAEREGVLLAGGSVQAAGPAWRDVPGAAPVGSPYRTSGPAARPLVAFLRLAERRARHGAASETHRLMLEEGDDFFRVVSARAESIGAGILVLLGRSDIPFGVFLAAGSLVAFVGGRFCLAYLLGDPAVPGARLLP
jgi:prepilin signal peptidase PulO-like enzyme (type II secretory pathway)